MTVHLYTSKHAGSALKSFAAGKSTLRSDRGKSVHHEDVPAGATIVVHSPLTKSKASTRREPT